MKIRFQFYLLLVVALLMSATALSVQAQDPVGEASSAESAQPAVVATATLPPAILSTSGCTPTFDPWQTKTLITGVNYSGRLYALQTSLDPHGENKVHRLIFSDNLGNTWSNFPNGLPLPSANEMNIDVDDQDRSILYVSTEMHMTYQKWYGLYKWTNGRWINRSSKQVGNLVVALGQMFGTQGTQLVNSANGGLTWQSVGSNGMQLGELYADPLANGTLYTMSEFGPSSIYRVDINGWNALPAPNGNLPSSMGIDKQSGDLYAITQTAPATLSRTSNARAAAVSDVTWEQLTQFRPEWSNVTLLTVANTNTGPVLFVKATLADGFSRTYRSVGALTDGLWQQVIFN